MADWLRGSAPTPQFPVTAGIGTRAEYGSALLLSVFVFGVRRQRSGETVPSLTRGRPKGWSDIVYNTVIPFHSPSLLKEKFCQ